MNLILSMMKFFHQTLLGGDQLTAARVRGSIAARRDHQTRRERLQGLLPVVEDWHAYLRYIYRALFTTHCCSACTLLVLILQSAK